MNFMQSGRVLTTLARDTAGNTLMIVAAALVPLVAIIGGGVDISRIYITKTRLQQACDAGALSGRKAMGSGNWTTSGTNNSRDQAYQLFASNFKSGDFGTGTLTREFTESDGTVSGVASTTVPMTLMQIFGYSAHPVSVACTAKMEIPNTDVMFVLDVTGSMAGSNIVGLKSAVKCFYEALLKVNTPEVCGGDPTASSYDGSAQIRLGFVPYSVNVNVGKLLPNAFLADNWTYQSRVVNTTPQWAWTAGTQSTISYGGWTPSSTPSSFNTASAYGSWTRASSSMTIGATTYPRQASPATSTNCTTNYNTMAGSSSTLAARADTGEASPSDDLQSSSAPTYPDTTQSLTYSRTDTRTVTGLRYRWFNPSGSDGFGCWLELGTGNYNRTQTGSATKPVTWTSYNKFVSYTYQPVSLNVSALKAGGSSWNPSVGVPIGLSSAFNINPSGSTTPMSIQIPANTTVSWGGCLEERQTFQNTDGDPSDDWDPIPAGALDMNIDLVPSSTPGTQWGPMLSDAIWGRYDGSGSTTNPVTTASTLSRNRTYSCTTAARKLSEYNTVGDLVSYIDSFTPSGNTYHDVGMLWGARLLSPTGIFASENALTANGGAIERHLIFMTDGDAVANDNNLYSFGLATHDRRQTSYAPSDAQLTRAVEARLTALCTQVKNMNIQLWVISYGGAVDAANEARLEACASPGHYYSAADGAALIARFKQIAAEIADLRLTE